MAQFGGQKNPPWAAQFTGTAVTQAVPPGVQPPPLLGTSPTMYTQQNSLATVGLSTPSPASYQLTQTAALQQQAVAVAALQQQYSQPQPTIYSIQQQLQQPPQAMLSQPAVALSTSLGLSSPQPATQITVSYPAPRSNQQQTPPQKQRVFTGVVTKLHDTFGFVDEDVFFQLSAVKGKTPQVGDRVLVEATYNPNMPFKWNAQRIQTLPNQNQAQPLLKTPASLLQPISQQAFSVQPPTPQPQTILQAQMSAASIAPLLHAQPPTLLQQQKAGLLQPPIRIIPQPQPARRSDPTSRFCGRNDRGDPSSNRRDDRSRERERRRSRTPQRKRSREISPRRERSPRRPRRSTPRYTVQFSKFSLDCANCDMMELRRRYQNLYIPSDFFATRFTWVDAFPILRPFQMGNYCNFYVMNREVDPLEKNLAVLYPPDVDHSYSAKVMLLASPSMEDMYHKSCALAEDPQELKDGFQHPARLVKFLVGMKGRDEAMAIGGHWSPSLDGPDPEKNQSVLIKTAIRCCKALTGIDLNVCTQWYRFAEIRYLRPEETHKGRTVPAHVETVVLFFPDVWHCLPTRSEWEILSRGYKQQLIEKLQGDRKEAEGEQEEEEKYDAESEELSTPTHWSQLDPKIMKVNDLRRELESRTLSSKGLKSQLIARLTKHLKIEEQMEQQNVLGKSEHGDDDEEEETKSGDDKEEEEKKRHENMGRQRLERRYVLPAEPAIIVHPNREAKNGKFDCSVMSLSVLLDYRLEDNKEHSFEVSLFAELFNEMLQRDFGVRIYKALLTLPERDDKKEKDKKFKKEDRKDKEEEDEIDDPKQKRRKSADGQDAKEEKEETQKEDKKREDSKEEDDKEDDYSQEEYAQMEAEDAEEEDKDRNDGESICKERRDDRGEELRHCKERHSKEKENEKHPMITVNKDLLMAFIYFDQCHCGYLLEKDLEEILYTLGLHLSRAQVKKIMNKVALRESCFYRKLTDATKDEINIAISEELQEDMLGNKVFLPAPVSQKESNSSEQSGGLFMYNGAMVDVGSILKNLEKSEKARAEIEQKLLKMMAKTAEDAREITQLEECKQGLSEELKVVKKDLTLLQERLEASESVNVKYEGQLNKTVQTLSVAMEELHSVLKKDSVKGEEPYQKPDENRTSLL
ncbi:cell division cycle and apoptosis regulator protein 1 isoform X3 [Lissotriton helveticus]